MRATKERMDELKRRVHTERRRREKRGVTALSVACVTLCTCLLRLAGAFGSSAPHQAVVPELYGSTLLFENAGGYVLVGVIAFTAAAAITVLCIRHREKGKQNKAEDERKEKET